MLERVLARIKEAGLTVNREKSVFGRSEIKYLGVLVNRDGFRPDPDKITPVIEYPEPKNLKQLGASSVWPRGTGSSFRIFPRLPTLSHALLRKTLSARGKRNNNEPSSISRHSWPWPPSCTVQTSILDSCFKPMQVTLELWIGSCIVPGDRRPATCPGICEPSTYSGRAQLLGYRERIPRRLVGD